MKQIEIGVGNLEQGLTEFVASVTAGRPESG